jgi:hypothetical protein
MMWRTIECVNEVLKVKVTILDKKICCTCDMFVLSNAIQKCEVIFTIITRGIEHHIIILNVMYLFQEVVVQRKESHLVVPLLM